MSNPTELHVVPETVEPAVEYIAPHESHAYTVSHNVKHKGVSFDYTSTACGDNNRLFLVIPGHTGIEPAYDRFREELATETEAIVFSYKHPRTEDGIRDMRLSRLVHPDQIGKEAAIIMVRYLRKMYPELRVTLIGHSMGGPAAIDAAIEIPDDIEDVILLGSGGLEQDQNLGRLAKRMPGVFVNEGRSVLSMPKQNVVGMIGQVAYHLFRNPLRTLGETISIGHRNLMEKEISEVRDRGIGVFAVQLEHDGFFPTSIAERQATHLVDSLTVIEGLDHVGPQACPKIVALHIAELLRDRRPRLASIA